ncbi:hypothetical protein HYT57_05575 [Candidatus Woesearchaeota archaeon]|nr:hypothetical protein [Candidatus Woesearchaeota archaeon]
MDIPRDFYSLPLPVEYRDFENFDPTYAGKRNARRSDAATAIRNIELIARVDGADSEETIMSKAAQRVASEELVKLFLRGGRVDFTA